MKRRRKRRGEDSKSLWKERAWAAFSEYIRRKDADSYGIVACFTCGVEKHWKNMQAGHFIDGRTGSVLFEEDIVRPQCDRCNRRLKGNKDSYSPKMIKIYGIQKVEEFWGLKNKIVQRKLADYKEIHDKYSAKLAELSP